MCAINLFAHQWKGLGSEAQLITSILHFHDVLNFRWMLRDIDDTSTLAQVMVWCFQAEMFPNITQHYMSSSGLSDWTGMYVFMLYIKVHI